MDLVTLHGQLHKISTVQMDDSAGYPTVTHQKVRTATDEHHRQTIYSTKFQNVSQAASCFRLDPELSRTTHPESRVLGKRLIQFHFSRTHDLSELQRHLEVFGQFGGFFVDISRSKTEDQISRFRDSSDLPM